MAIEDDVRLRLSLQRALLTHITPELRSVSADVTTDLRLIRIQFTFSREPSDSERNAASCAATEVISDYPDSWTVDEEYQIVPYMVAMVHLRLLVYHRCEDQWVSRKA